MTAAVSVAGANDTLNNKAKVAVDSKEMLSEVSDLDSAKTTSNSNSSKDLLETTIIVNPLLNEFVDCIENLPNRLQLLLSELRNVDAQVNLQHRRIQLIKQQILSKTIEAATTSFSVSKSDGGSSSGSISDVGGDIKSADMSDTKFTIEQLLNKLHQMLLQCQSLGDQKVKLSEQIMEILSNKTRKLGLDAKSNEERNFQIELDEDKILKEFKIAIKKRSMHAKKNQLAGGINSMTNRTSSRHVHNAHNLQTGSSKSKQQHLNSAEVNKVVAKYTKTSNSSSYNNTNSQIGFKYLSNTRSSNPIDAYSFDNDDQQSSVETLNNRLKSNKHDLETDTKSLRSLNNLMNGNTNGKKVNLRSKYSDMKLNGGSVNNKKSTKKLRDSNLQFVSSSKKNFKANDGGSLNNRPKRQLNYTNNSLDKSSTETSGNKKRRLNQFKSSRLNSASLDISLTNESSMNQCNSPSSSSTSSMNTTKQKNGRLGNKSNPTNKVIKSEKLPPRISEKNNRSKRKSAQIKQSDLNKRMVKKNKKSSSNKSPYTQRRTNRTMENHDDADDDLSDEVDEYSATHFDSDNENENDEDTDIENREFNKKNIKPSDNDDLNSNETESINEFDEMNNSDNEEMDDEEDDGEGDNEENDSMLTENEDETSEDYKNTKKLRGLMKTFGYNNTNKNYESYNEENSENDLTLSSSKSKNKTTRIKSLLYQHKNNSSNSFKSENHNQQIEFPSSIESEPIYCVCSEISYGNMICCDNDNCKIEWFHFACVKLNSKPKGKWYCPNCRGDNHKVMKKNLNTSSPSNYNQNLSSYRTK